MICNWKTTCRLGPQFWRTCIGGVWHTRNMLLHRFLSALISVPAQICSHIIQVIPKVNGADILSRSMPWCCKAKSAKFWLLLAGACVWHVMVWHGMLKARKWWPFYVVFPPPCCWCYFKSIPVSLPMIWVTVFFPCSGLFCFVLKLVRSFL